MFAARVAAALRPRGRWVPRSLGMCVLAKMYYGLWGECRRFRAVWLTRCVGCAGPRPHVRASRKYGRGAFAAQGRGKEVAPVAFDVLGVLVALTHTASYVLFACYMMHAAYCSAYYVHGSGAGPTKTQRAQSSSKVTCVIVT